MRIDSDEFETGVDRRSGGDPDVDARTDPTSAPAAGDGPIVLKFGSSVLRNPADLPTVVTEIYRYARSGRGVVAVVSAFEGETDALLKLADAFGAGARSRHAPRLISLGEEKAASLLAIACDRVGLSAVILGARRLNLRATGAVDDAAPEGADPSPLWDALKKHDLVIAPGFVAISPTGEPVLLGRGGSDLTAVVLADALGLSSATLVKDVDGVYERDPAGPDGVGARLFERLDWTDAASVAGGLLQSKAIEFAERRNIELRVARPGAARATRVGAARRAEFVSPDAAPSRVLRVAIAGLGVVGGGVAERLLAEPSRYELTGVLVSDGRRQRDRQINPALLTTRPETLLESRPDVFVDALSCGETGRALLSAALAAGVSATTANKQAIADDLPGLRRAAGGSGAHFMYSAAVGGGAPMIETTRRARDHGPVSSIAAVLNGTINYILSSLQAGASFDAALAAAQEAGFAEADPSADLSGADAEAKIKILSEEAFGSPPDALDIEALTPARANAFATSGLIWRQLARLERRADGRVVAQLAYAAVEEDNPFAALSGEANALVATCADGAVFRCAGRGAGRLPTAESLLADVAEIERALS